MRILRRQLVPAVLMLAVFTVLTGLIYPLVVTGIGQAAFSDQANGSLIRRNGVVVGSSLLGQGFADPKYFHPRPSAAGSGYDGTASGGSNLGPTNPDFLKAVQQRVSDYRTENGLSDSQLVPVDAVTASGSGLDPHISVANARIQAPRVAKARGLQLDAVLKAVNAHTDSRWAKVLGDSGVNVVELNLALDGG